MYYFIMYVDVVMRLYYIINIFVLFEIVVGFIFSKFINFEFCFINIVDFFKKIIWKMGELGFYDNYC